MAIIKRQYDNHHPLYRRWHDMRQRCNNKKCKSYKNYGGRGIIISEELKDFRTYARVLEALPDYDLENSIDRIDNDLDYTSDNLRWTSKSVQSANRRRRLSGSNNYAGVRYKNDCGRWVSRLKYEGKSILNRTFRTEKEALEARNKFITDNNLPHPIQEFKE